MHHQLRQINTTDSSVVKTDNYVVPFVMTDVIGVGIGEMFTTMDDLEDTALFVLPTPTDMGIEMESGITALLGFMFKSDFEGYSISSLWGSLHVC